MCALAKKKAVYKYIDLAVEAYEEYFEILFFRWGSAFGFNYRRSLWHSRRRAYQNWIIVDVSGRTVKIFQFAKVINEWPLNGRIIETGVRISSFDFRMVCIKAILDELFIDFRLTFCCWFPIYILFFVSVVDLVIISEKIF